MFQHIKPNCFSSILTGIAIAISFLVGVGSAQEVVEITSALSKRPQATFYDLRCDLGSLELGKKKSILIHVENNTEFDLQFATAKLFCACSKVESKGNLIPSGGTIDLKVKLDTPRSSRKVDVRTGFALVDENDKTVVRVALNYSIKGLVAFGRSVVTKSVRLDGAVKTIELPFVYSDPIQLNSLMPSSSFDEAVFELKKTQSENVGILSVSIPEFDIGDAGTTGKITLANSLNQDTSSVLVSIHPIADISVTPKLAYLRQDEEDAAKFTANFIIRFNPEESPEATKHQDGTSRLITGSESVTCAVDGFNAIVKLSKVTNTIYRAKLQLAKKESDNDKKSKSDADAAIKARWKIRGNGLSSDIETTFSFK